MKGSCLWCGNPLPKRRRKYCCDDCNYKYWQKYIAWRFWNVARNLALERDNFKCQDCGGRGSLEVHHIIRLEPGEDRWKSDKNAQENLVTLCCPCHELRHHPKLAEQQLEPSCQGSLL